MDEDEVNRTHFDATEKWCGQILDKFGPEGVQRLASSYRDNQACLCVQKNNGSFNICYKVVFDDGVAWAVRFAVAGRVMHREEKVRREVAILKFLKEKTRVPVARIVAFGTAMDDDNIEIGPFVITEWIQGISLTSVMERVPQPPWGAVLRDDIDDETFYKIYRQMARIYLELSLYDFDKIGALSAVEYDDGSTSWSITSRPMTMKVNDIEGDGYVVTDDHKLAPFQTTAEYMDNLVQQNLVHLNEQRNSVDDAEDAERKYVNKKLAANILVDADTMQITGVIDWEWTYSAPYQFLFSPPTWLILLKPALWSAKDDAIYEKKLQIFIKSLEDEEEVMQTEKTLNLPSESRMSSLMRRSLIDGEFWITALLQHSFLFDEEWLWQKVENALKAKGLDKSGFPSKSDIAEFVQMKMKRLNQYNAELQRSTAG